MTVSSESAAKYGRVIQQRYNEFTKALDSTLKNFGEQRGVSVTSAASKLADSGDKLTALLSPIDTPKWLSEVTQNARSCATNDGVHSMSYTLLKSLLAHNDSVRSSKLWDTATFELVSFDNLYAKVIDENDIRSHFDQLINELQQIIDADVLDSRVITSELEKLIALLQANRDGTSTSVNGAIALAIFSKHAVLEYLTSSSIVGPLAKAAIKTIDELDKRKQKAEQRFIEESRNQVMSVDVQERLKIATSQDAVVMQVDFARIESNDE